MAWWRRSSSAQTQVSGSSIPSLPDLRGFISGDQPFIQNLISLTKSDEYTIAAHQFENWPVNSYISHYERAVLHGLISETRARSVLEIGSAFAGTTKLLSTSMLQAGAAKGKVYTIDPYGADRVPGLIAAWPKSLREITVFWPKFSSDVFIPSLDIPPFDVVLIDGNHSYPNVMHDLFAAYEGLRYGGFMVADNAEQQDVLEAVRDFLKLTPEAEAARLSVTGPTGSDHAFEIDDTLDTNDSESAFIVVRKPLTMRIGRKSLAFHLNRLRGLTVSSVEATVRNESDRPILLRGRLNLRSLPSGPNDTTAHDLGQGFSAEVGPGAQVISFPIRTLELPPGSEANRNFVELNLFSARDGESVILESMKINGFPVQPGRNFMQPAR